MTTGVEKLHLEDALEDSPQMRSMLSLFEEDVSQVRKYTYNLYQHCQKILDAENELTSATRNLADHLKNYEKINFPLECDKESVLATTMKQFADTLDEVSSWHHILATQLTDGMLFPLTRFIQADLEEIKTMCELFQVSSNDLEKAITKYCKLPKRKDYDREKNECNEEVYLTRKKFHQISLHYYANLNALQYKRKSAMIEPLLGYLHAQRSHFALGNEALNTPDLDTFLNNISASIQGVHSEMGKETKATVNLIDALEKQSQHMYYPEPQPNMPRIPPNTSLTQKTGYLYMRSKVVGVVNKWEKVYCFTQGGNLMSVSKGELVGSLILELDANVNAQPLEHEDRRFVFQVTNGKKNVVLQAINERERDEWIATIKNVVKDDSYIRDKNTESTVTAENKSLFSASGHSTQKNPDRSKNTKTAVVLPHAIDGVLPATPIVFDMISPSEDNKMGKCIKEGPPVRINPFDQSSTKLAAEALRSDNTFHEVYTVRFLGSMEVKYDRGERLVHETIRQIMAARAIHNVFKMTESHMVITNEVLRLVDPSNQSVKAEFALQNISFWAAHKENNRLIGFITRAQDGTSEPRFICHVFESNSSGEEISTSLQTATKIAYLALKELSTGQALKEKEKEILLQNLSMQDEIDGKPVLSKDGQFIILDNGCTAVEENCRTVVNPDIRDGSADGDERKVEGAESEA